MVRRRGFLTNKQELRMPGAAYEALRVAAKPFTVPLAIWRGRLLVDAGSAVLLRVGDVAVVCTAGHLASHVRDGGGDLAVHCPGAIRLLLPPPYDLVATWPHDNHHRDDHTDIAVIRLREPHAAALADAGWEFLGLDVFEDWYEGRAWPPQDALCPFGFPEDHEGRPGRVCLTLHSVPDPGALKLFDPRLHVALAYPDHTRGDSARNTDGVLIRPVHPAGFSGAGVWALTMAKLNRWKPEDARLVGLVTEFDAENDRLRFTKIGVVREAIRRGCPDLAISTLLARPEGIVTPLWLPELL
jgi:hypothetical protein